MLSCLITVYNFSTPGTKPILCVLRTNQHRLNFEGLCIPLVGSRKHLLNHMDCGYTLRKLNSCSEKVYGKKSDPCHGKHYFFLNNSFNYISQVKKEQDS